MVNHGAVIHYELVVGEEKSLTVGGDTLISGEDVCFKLPSDQVKTGDVKIRAISNKETVEVKGRMERKVLEVPDLTHTRINLSHKFMKNLAVLEPFTSVFEFDLPAFQTYETLEIAETTISTTFSD